jgi:hypothetical protein
MNIFPQADFLISEFFEIPQILGTPLKKFTKITKNRAIASYHWAGLHSGLIWGRVKLFQQNKINKHTQKWQY